MTQRIPQQRSDLIHRQVDDDFVVYDPVKDRSAVLNATAALIFQCCDGARDVTAIAKEVSRVFGEPMARVLPDVEATVARLIEDRLLT